MNQYESFLTSMLDPDKNVAEYRNIETVEDFINTFSGASFGNGVYRIFQKNKIEHWNQIVGDYFSDYRGKIVCFGYDWLGRVFALDCRDNPKGSNVLMFDPATANVMKIPANFESFHNDEIVNYANEALDAELFLKWLAQNTPLQFSTCVGHKIPLFLSGSDDFDNMEIVDMEVNWEILKSLHKQIQDTDSPITSVNLK